MSAPLVDFSVQLEKTYAALQAKVPPELISPRVGIVCGSGLSTLAEKSLRNMVEVLIALRAFSQRDCGSCCAGTVCCAARVRREHW